MSDADREILQDQDVSWQRWEMDSLPRPRSQALATSGIETQRRAEAIRREAQRRQAELEAIEEEACRVGHEQGYREGLEAGRADGHAQGLKEGRREAREAFDEETRTLLTPLLPLATQFSEALERLDEEVANALVELALATGRQLAGDALKTRPRQVLEIVRALLHTEPAMHGKPRLWLHPLDHKLVAEHLGHELEAAGWRLQPDDQITRGGCRVIGTSGELDATWESRWEAVRQQIRRRKPADTGKTPRGGASK